MKNYNHGKENRTQPCLPLLGWTRQIIVWLTCRHFISPLVSQAATTKDLWDILAKTYAKPSRGHIKQLKEQLNNILKGNKTITEYMQAIKSCADHLTALGKSVDHV